MTRRRWAAAAAAAAGRSPGRRTLLLRRRRLMGKPHHKKSPRGHFHLTRLLLRNVSLIFTILRACVGRYLMSQEEGMALLQQLSTLGDSWPEPIRRAVFDYLPS